ncbi:MAG TPA: RNA polymerase sigma factor [Acidobacteriota bacterium]|jgi:RNA polymerase sigma-70 factor (ECF subfamily)
MTQSQDAILVERSLEGDELAFAELVKRHQGIVSRRVYRILGKSLDHADAVQEVFLRVYNSLRRYDPKRPFEPWISRIATNYCIDQLRRPRSGKVMLWTDLEEGEQRRLLSMTRNGDFESILREGLERYQEVAMSLLQELKPKERVAFIMREVENRSYLELARALDVSELGARIRVSRARKKLQAKFHAYLEGFGKR